MSEAVNVIAEGEVLRLMNVNDGHYRRNYMRVIYSKNDVCSKLRPVLRYSRRFVRLSREGLRDYGATLVRLSSSLTICWITVPTASIGKCG